MTIADRAAQLQADDCRLDETELRGFRVWLDRKPFPVGSWRDWLAVEPCARCDGRGHVVEECATFGWRMVPCAECNAPLPIP